MDRGREEVMSEDSYELKIRQEIELGMVMCVTGREA